MWLRHLLTVTSDRQPFEHHLSVAEFAAQMFWRQGPPHCAGSAIGIPARSGGTTGGKHPQPAAPELEEVAV
jgi:hypothetical protein